MYEIKRIFLDKKLIIVFAAILICNAFIFYKERVSPYKDEEYYSSDYLDNYNKTYAEIVEKYKEMDLNEAAKDSEDISYNLAQSMGQENEDRLAAEKEKNWMQRLFNR